MILTVCLFVVIAAALTGDFIYAYRKTSRTVQQRIVTTLHAAAKSAWTGFTVLATALITGLAQLADLVNEPSLAAALQTYGKPSVVAGIMIASAAILAAV